MSGPATPPAAPPRPSVLPILALVVANVAMAGGPFLVRLAGEQAHVGAVAAAFWRLALALPVLAIAAVIAGEAPFRRGPSLPLAVAAGVLFAVDIAAWHLGIVATRLANAALLANAPALLFPVYGFLAARAGPSRGQALALALALLGAALLLGRSVRLSPAYLAGDLLSLGAGLCYTAYLILVDRVRGQAGPLATLTVATAAAVPVLLAILLWRGERLWPDAWTPLLLLAAGSQLVGQGLVLYAIGCVPPLAVGVLLLIQPVVSGVIDWARYGERLGAVDLVGAVAIGAAIVLIRDARRLPPRADAVSP